MGEKIECSGCGKEFERLGMHWAFNDECVPELSQKQKEICNGIMMGDAWIETTHKNARMCISVITEEYLEYLHKIFYPITTGVKLKESFQKRLERRPSSLPGETVEKASDLYRLQTRTHPYFNRYNQWYSDGDKTFPVNIELTPTTLKHWFVCDGCFQMANGTTPYLTLGMANEIGNQEKIRKYFDDIDIEIGSFNIGWRSDSTKNMAAIFNKESTLKMFNYMGEALPGFEYKFPQKYGGETEVFQ